MRLITCLLLLSCTLHAQDLEKAIQLFNDRKHDEARKIFETVKEGHQRYHQARYYLGRISFINKEYDEAEEYLEESIEANSKMADYHYWLGNVIGTVAQTANTIRQGMLAPKIKSAYEQAVALDQQHLGALNGLIEYYTQAPGFMGGSWEKAEETARKIMKFNKAEGHRAMAVVYQRQEKMNEAEQQYLAAYKADPAYVNALTVFYTNNKMYDKAFSLFDEMLKKNPEDMSAAYQFGKACALSGKRLDAGESYLTKYLSYTPKANEPSHAGANMRLGQIKEKKGDKQGAKRFYEKALQLDNTMKEAREGLDRTK